MSEFTPHDFVNKWKQVTAREKQTYQEHFLDLCRLLHEPTPNEVDPSGTRYAFEMGAAKTTGGQGWADVARLGYFGWEYKSKDADLDKAYAQLLLYRDALQNPPALVVSDINNIIVRTLTNLYNARPTWLDLAHKRLDQAVFAAYGWPPGLTDEQILEKRLALNLERASQA